MKIDVAVRVWKCPSCDRIHRTPRRLLNHYRTTHHGRREGFSVNDAYQILRKLKVFP